MNAVTPQDAFLTGATGFIGRRLLKLLLGRPGDVHVLVRRASLPKITALAEQLGAPERIKPVIGDLSAPMLGVDQRWIAEHVDQIGHVFHLAAVYDLEASEEANEVANVGGTRETVLLAGALRSGCLHHVSSVAVAGNYVGTFTEEMFDEGQPLPHPYHRTKFESERIAREESTTPWRVYRPAIVVGDSHTGEMDKLDGPYYLFPLIDGASRLPGALRALAPRLGATNVVPVDYVAAALDHLAHRSGLDGRAFHLVNPEPQPTLDLINLFAEIAGSPQLVGVLPGALLDLSLRLGPVRREVLPRLGIPAAALDHAAFTCTFASEVTRDALAGSGIEVPPLEEYAPVLWDYWKQHLRKGQGS